MGDHLDRVPAAWRSYFFWRRVLHCRQGDIKQKLQLLRSTSVASLIYAAEAKRLSPTLVKTMQTFEHGLAVRLLHLPRRLDETYVDYFIRSRRAARAAINSHLSPLGQSLLQRHHSFTGHWLRHEPRVAQLLDINGPIQMQVDPQALHRPRLRRGRPP
eukprot:6458404-Amphidinium_carterae.1